MIEDFTGNLLHFNSNHLTRNKMDLKFYQLFKLISTLNEKFSG